MDLPARRLARASTHGRELHIIDWRKELDGHPPSLCGPELVYEPGTVDPTLPVCRDCLTAEEMLRTGIVFADIRVSRMTIEGMTVAQAMLAALQNDVPGTAIFACEGGTPVLQWYEAAGQEATAADFSPFLRCRAEGHDFPSDKPGIPGLKLGDVEACERCGSRRRVAGNGMRYEDPEAARS